MKLIVKQNMEKLVIVCYYSAMIFHHEPNRDV